MGWLFEKISQMTGGEKQTEVQAPEKDAQDLYGNAAAQDAMKQAQAGDASWWDRLWGEPEEQGPISVPVVEPKAKNADADPVELERFEQDVAIAENTRARVDEYNAQYDAALEKWRVMTEDYNRPERDMDSPTGWKEKPNPGPRPEYKPPCPFDWLDIEGRMLPTEQLRARIAKRYPTVQP